MEAKVELGAFSEEVFGVWGSVCIESGRTELERSSPAHKSVKRNSISESERRDSRKEVGGEHSTKDVMDNKTITREGSLLNSSFWRR